MTNFKLKGAPLSANIDFMDIHKGKKLKNHHTDRPLDAFDHFKNFQHKVGTLFSDLAKDHQFWTIDGTPLHNLHELYDAFDTMTDDTYQHHVTGDKNDFATWISNVYHDEDLAYKLHRAKNRQQSKRAIEDRIEELINVGEQHATEDSFFKALVKKLSKHNQKLESALIAKKQWILKKEKEMGIWESKNLEQEKRVFEKHQQMEMQEKDLYKKFQGLQTQENKLNTALVKEKKEIEKQSEELKNQQKQIMQEQHIIQKEKHQLDNRKDDIRLKRALRVKHVMSQKNKHIYERVDELLSYAAACVFNRNYKEARDTMSKVKYYYNTLPNEDPHKKDVYKKIIQLRKQITETVRM